MKKIIFTALFMALTAITFANNIQLANVSINGQNTVSQFTLVNFDVSWENSWRTITNENNYDGAWIFVKFRKKTSSLWQHATIAQLGFTTPAGSVIQPSLDGKGVWIYHVLPGADFTGNVNYAGAKLQWNYGADGVLNTDSVEVRVFALEMVYIPVGAFKVGSGGTETNHFVDGSSNNPYNVASEAAITVGVTAGNLNYTSGSGLGGDQAGPIPAAFPKGFNAYWIMKYEASQQQYVDFLNNLDLARASNRYGPVITGTHPNLTVPSPEKAMNLLNILDGLAFADWAGLRPFTELEYEKACRGYNQAPLPNEFVWGSTTAVATTAITGGGTASETASNGNANFASGTNSVLRCGIYATASSTRQSSGGSYYGVMDMAGNVSEYPISVGSPFGRAFTATNGDGTLDNAGDANTATWPTASAGFAARGGYYGDVVARLQTSDRTQGIYSGAPTTRSQTIGIRLARTAE